INDLVPDSSYQDIKRRLAGYRTGNMFNPPSKEGTVIFPGFDGGAEWGGPAFDPETSMRCVNADEMPWARPMRDAPKQPLTNGNAAQAGKRIDQSNCMNCHGPAGKGAGNYPSILGANKPYSGEQLEELLLSGRRMMPGFKHLPEEERQAVSAFVLENRKELQKDFIPPEKVINEYLDLPYWFTGYNKFETIEGYPAVQPRWG